jgi:D-sedoheptulose 7-phosphate isomerase
MVGDIRLLVLDIDGVLTDGTGVVGTQDGERKRFSFQDLDAVSEARRVGLAVALVTGEDTEEADRIAARFGVELVKKGAKDKLAAITEVSSELGVPLESVCYMGDADRDAPALARVGLGIAPANATSPAKAAAHRVLRRAGGAGAVAEAVSILLAVCGDRSRLPKLQDLMRSGAAEGLAAHRRLIDESLPVLADIALALMETIRVGRKVLLFGNGGSAADAQHVAAELVGRFARDRAPLPAIALTTDTSILTAVSNDWEFSEVFARQVTGLARPGDTVVGISTSGSSPNVLRGLAAGREAGSRTIGFTGGGGGGMPPLSDLCFIAPAVSPSRVQELHIVAWHMICEVLERELSSMS